MPTSDPIDFEERMKKLDEEGRKIDRFFKWTMILILVFGCAAAAIAFAYEHSYGSARSQWAHRLCRQTCRALDYRPLMFYRLPRMRDDSVETYPASRTLDGLVCRCAAPNNLLLVDEDGTRVMVPGRGQQRAWDEEMRRSAAQ